MADQAAKYRLGKGVDLNKKAKTVAAIRAKYADIQPGQYGEIYDELNTRLKSIDCKESKIIADAINDPALREFAAFKERVLTESMNQELYL